VVVNMPRKAKPIVSPDEVWIAPRPANPSKPLAFEPVGTADSNRYLEFADIALGAKKSPSHKKKPRNVPGHAPKQHAQQPNPEGKLIAINRTASTPRGPKHGFGAFRGPR
jgi:hypothetical protein